MPEAEAQLHAKDMLMEETPTEDMVSKTRTSYADIAPAPASGKWHPEPEDGSTRCEERGIATAGKRGTRVQVLEMWTGKAGKGRTQRAGRGGDV